MHCLVRDFQRGKKNNNKFVGKKHDVEKQAHCRTATELAALVCMFRYEDESIFQFKLF